MTCHLLLGEKMCRMSDNLNLAIDTIASAVVSRLDAIIGAPGASLPVSVASSSTTSSELPQSTNTGQARNPNDRLNAAAGPSNISAASSNITVS